MGTEAGAISHIGGHLPDAFKQQIDSGTGRSHRGAGNADGESIPLCGAVTAPENVWQIARSREVWTHEAPAPIDMARLQSEMESGLTLQQGKQGGQDV